MDVAQGQGKCVFKDQAYYEGTLKLGKRNGAGKYVWPNDTKYEGNWRYDIMEGYGHIT